MALASGLFHIPGWLYDAFLGTMLRKVRRRIARYVAGEGLFQAAYDLPGSNDWPAPLQSSIKSLTLAFGCDLGEFDWETGALDCPLETLMTLYPDDSAAPGPATLLLLIPAAALLRRR